MTLSDWIRRMCNDGLPEELRQIQAEAAANKSREDMASMRKTYRELKRRRVRSEGR